MITLVREIAFIDPAVSDVATLLAGLRPQVDAFLLDHATPAPAQIARVVAKFKNLGAIHVIAHGAPGELCFTAESLSVDTVEVHCSHLAAIGSALAKNGALLLWSCKTGQGHRGVEFVEALERATGVTVAVADGLVGSARCGAAWKLSASALPPVTPALQAAYAGTLDGTSITTNNNTTVNQNNTSVAETDTITGNGNDTVNLNNSTGPDSVIINGNGNDTVNLNNSGGCDTVMITGSGSDTINANNSSGSDILVAGNGNDTINLNNSTGNDIVYGGNGNDTINANNSTGTDVFIAGAGSDVVNGGANNDLAIYALSDHYTINAAGQLQSIAGDVDYYYGNGGTNTLRVVLTQAEYALVYEQLFAYQQWLKTNPGPNQTYSFTFGTGAVGLVVAGWQKLLIEVVSPGLQGASIAMPARGTVKSLFSNGNDNGSSTLQSATPVSGLWVLGVNSGSNTVGTSLDPTTLAQVKSLGIDPYAGTANPTAYVGSVAGAYGYGTLTFSADGTYNYTLNGTELGASASETFNITTMDANGFITSTTLTFIADPLQLSINGPFTNDEDGSAVINSANATQVSFTVHGLGLNKTGSITFKDNSGHSVTVQGVGDGSNVVNLSGLNDGPIAAALSWTDKNG